MVTAKEGEDQVKEDLMGGEGMVEVWLGVLGEGMRVRRVRVVRGGGGGEQEEMEGWMRTVWEWTGRVVAAVVVWPGREDTGRQHPLRGVALAMPPLAPAQWVVMV